MNPELQQLSQAGRAAVQKRDWTTLEDCAAKILERWNDAAEGWFLAGLAEKNRHRPLKAARNFERALEIDAGRYDAAIELAGQHSLARKNAEAAALLDRYGPALANSPLYLNMAGSVYTQIGLPEKGVPLLEAANRLQPDIDLFQANLATCYVYLGRIDEARRLYAGLLERFPAHQRNHYEYARLGRATDETHIRQMKDLLKTLGTPPEQNVFLYYAIGKELEDLERWDEAFGFYRTGGNAVASVAKHDAGEDVAIVDAVIESCNADWLAAGKEAPAAERHGRTPILVTGLPRTGTTLTERIVSSHSQVTPVGEPQFFPMAVRQASGTRTTERMNADIVRGAAAADVRDIGDTYMEKLSYRIGDTPFFVDKLPFNFLFLGFAAKAWPDARLVVLWRHPLDSCYAMYKQVFTWAYKFSYTLEDLGRYYIAHERLYRHWQELLGDRLVTLRYEDLVGDQEGETRTLLERLGLEFEEACLDFDRNPAASTTASSVQVREKIHDRSVGRWKQVAPHLEPLRRQLEDAGIDLG